MKIIHESSDKLQLRSRMPHPGGCLVTLAVTVVLAGVTLAVISSMSEKMGVMSLQCNRPTPESVSCQRQQTADFGLVQKPAQTYHQVTGAELKKGRGQNHRGETEEYWVTLQTSQGETILLEAPMVVNRVKGDRRQMGGLAQEINDFIQSDQATLNLQRDNRLSYVTSFVMPSLFLVVFLVPLYITFQIEELTFNRKLGVLQRKRLTLLGPRYRKIPLGSISGVCINASRYDSFCGITLIDPTYTFRNLNLLPQSLKARPITSSQDVVDLTAIQKRIEQFLASK